MNENGPYLQVAVLCERILEEKDGVLSPIRIIDQITLATPPAAGSEPSRHVIWALLSFKAGQSQGTHTIKLIPPPDLGMKTTEVSAEIELARGVNGVNIMVPLGITPGAAKEGEHWFDVVLDEHIVTRTPLRVNYQPAPAGDAQAASDTEKDADADPV